MRIALFCRSLPRHGMGGMELHAQQVARSLVARGHRVVAFTTRLQEGPLDEDNGALAVRYLAGTRPRSYLGGYWGASRRAFFIEHERQPFDAAYSESSGAYGILSDSRPIVPVVLYLVGTPLAEVRSKLRQGLTPRRILGIGWNLIGALQALQFVPRASIVLCESDGLRDWAVRELRLDPARTHVSWLGADTTHFTPDGPMHPDILRVAPDEPRIVFGGRLEKEKGFDIALRAVAALDPGRHGSHAVLIGSGREREGLRRIAEQILRPERFHMLPPIEHDRLPEMYRAATIYLMPTIRQEGSALSVVEAMACGRPIISSRIGGIPTILRDSVDALLVPPGDAGQLKFAIERLLDEPELRGRLGAEARRSASARYGLDAMVDRVEEALGDAVRNRGTGR